MSESVYAEMEMFAVAFVYGVAILLIYDVLRIIRRVIPHGQVRMAIEDMLFWICVTLAIFKMLFYRNDGALRFYIIASSMLGMFIYSITVSRYIVKYVSKFLNKIVKYLLKPLKIVIKAIRMVTDKIKDKVKKWSVKRKTHIARRRRERAPDVKDEDGLRAN